MKTNEFVSRLGAKGRPRKTSSGWQCCCPAHEDKNASLSVGEGADGRILLHCHAGCSTDSICAALGLKVSDLFTDQPARNEHARKIVATYDYHDASGKLLFEVVRFEPKDFRQRKPDATAPDGWTWNTKDVEKVLFRLPEILRAIQSGKFIFLCEGEKDVLAMVQRGFDATCNPGGAGKWQDGYSETLRGADVVILPDKDAPGQAHAQLVAGKLHGVAKSVRVIELPDVQGKPVKDAFDFFAAGGDAGQIGALVDAAPEWTLGIKIEVNSPGEQAADGDGFNKITSDLRGEILGILMDKTSTPAAQRREVCERVIAALHRVGRFYFHAEFRDFDSALFFNRFTKRLERVRADAFVSWISSWLCVNKADTLFKYIIAAVETESLSGERTTGILPESFWASRPGAIYISCGDGQVVKIAATGIETVDNGADSILFYAGKTCSPWQLVPPKDIFGTCAIFREAHTTAGHAPDLLRAWIYSLPTSPKCKPPLLLVGAVGAGKTALAKSISQLFGIAPAISKVEEMTESNFWPCVNDGGIYCLDNADTRTTWLADTVAAASTDGSSRRRKLYCDSETVILKPRAWLILTSSNPTFGGDSGLADRLLVCRMERRESESSDSSLADEITANRDAGLSHLAETLHKALADTAPTPGGLNHRHPDFAALAVRIGRAIGREAETIHALQSAEQDKSLFCLENDSIATALIVYLNQAQSFTGTAAELVPKLQEIDGDLVDKLSAKRLSKRLTALWPHLKKQLATTKRETDRKGFIVFTFKTAGKADSAEIADFQTHFP
jgi:hypothetical protein